MIDLDRLLCERLGIAPTEHWPASESVYDASVVPSLEYPALSTTGDGMVMLMNALGARNDRVALEQVPGLDRNELHRRKLSVDQLAPVLYKALVYVKETDKVGLIHNEPSAPLAVALAAADALGIKVPE
jgi:hypothetical protein